MTKRVCRCAGVPVCPCARVLGRATVPKRVCPCARVPVCRARAQVDYGEPFKLHGYLGTMSVAAVTATTSVVTWTNTYQTCDAAHSKAALNGFVPLIKAMFETIPAKASSVL